MHLDFLAYIDPNTHQNIDTIILAEVMPYVKTLQALPPSWQAEAEALASTHDPLTYFCRLRSAWDQHNALAKMIGTCLVDIYTERSPRYAPATLARCQDLLISAQKIEHEKRILSAGVKIALQKFVDDNRIRYGLSDADINLLLTPGVPSFWMYYPGEHAEYILARRVRDPHANARRENLLQRFHAADPAVLDSRLAGAFQSLANQSLSQLEAYVERYRQYLANVRDLATRSIYLVLERPLLQYIQKLVAYDNLQEYLYGCNLYGVPDLFLRKLLVDMLVKQGFLHTLPSVLLYSDDELQTAMANAVSTCERRAA